MNYQFVNTKGHVINVPGPDGKMVSFTPGQRKTLDEYFKRYVPKYLTATMIVGENNTISKAKMARNSVSVNIKRSNNNQNTTKTTIKTVQKQSNKKVVGRGVVGRDHATKFSKSRLSSNKICLSNNIGVGILSCNRLDSLIHLIESIRKHTDLTKTTIFISDESDDDTIWNWLKEQNDVIGFKSDREGISANTNRLLKCLQRFKFKLILNDDVEVLSDGWDTFYFKEMNKRNIHHFCYYQNGIYGASRPKPDNGLIKISEKPHGAVLALDDEAFKKVGYFDEKFGRYGFEHVDYSDRINRSFNLNCYYDVHGSDSYFRIYNDKSVDENKSKNFALAKEHYLKVKNDHGRMYIDNDRKLPSLSIVVPFRDIGRSKCVKTVINNLKSQKFPVVEILLVEQDQIKKMEDIDCINNIFIKNHIDNMHFCKSLAFNVGVNKASHENIILHDADMLVRSDYSKIIYEILNDYESTHVGKTVCYIDKESTEFIISNQKINEELVQSDRIVEYYEGGSLAIRKSVYFRIGGFCEDFIGYGNEDTEFYKRMVENSKSNTSRFIDLFHLWHGRTEGWMECHTRNQKIQESMFKIGKSVVPRLNKHLINKYGNDWSTK